MHPTDVADPTYFHKVVDCQWACPAHTPVPEYIRLIAQGRYDDAYMVNWESNVFPGILGRTCDRPCEPACRRGRVEEKNAEKPEAVAICRLKRVAADFKDGEVRAMLPRPAPKNGKRIACVGAGPASLTVARDLVVQGYAVTIFEGDAKAGGFMRTQVPRFRLPEEVIDEEVGYVIGLGVDFRGGAHIDSMKALLAQNFDAVFVGCGAPRGRELDIPGRQEAKAKIHIGIDWLASVYFGHVSAIGKRVIVLGGGNTAMDCCRSARRMGADDVKVIVRSTFEDMKASPWEKEDAMHEGIPILPCHVPLAFLHDDGQLTGMRFQIVKSVYDAKGKRSLVPTGEPDVDIPCDEVLVAVGQENAFPWIERDSGIEFNQWGLPVLDEVTFQASLPHVFFGGDAALGPKNIITAVAHGHEAAVSIDRLLHGEDVKRRPAPFVNMMSQKMGIHEWSYDNAPSDDLRFKVPWAKAEKALKSIKVEVELGFDLETAFKEAQRCLNCDVQTVFADKLCIECDACVDICPMDCITFTGNGDEADLRTRLMAPATNQTQDLYVGAPLKTGNVMVKDEDVCLHCGLCAERCPTGAWDMQKFLLLPTKAGPACRDSSPAVQRARAPYETHRSGQRLRRQVRQRQRLGVGVGQRVVRQGDPAHGRAGEPAQHLPEQHPGPAHLVRGARQRAGLARPARRHRHGGGDEPADLGCRRQGDRARRLPVLRQHQAAAGKCLSQGHQRHRHAGDRDLQRHLRRPAPAHAVQEHHGAGRAVGADGRRRDGDREPVRRDVQGQGAAAGEQRARAARRPQLRHRSPQAATGSASGPEGASRRSGGRSASSSRAMQRRRSAASMAAPPSVRGIRSRRRRRWPRRSSVIAASTGSTPSPARTASRSSRPKTRSRRSASSPALDGTAHARSPRRRAPACR